MVAPLVQDVAERRRESGKGGIAQVAHHIELREGHALAIDLYRDRIGEGWDEQGCAADLARREIPGEIAPDGAGGAGHFRRGGKGEADDLSRSGRCSRRVERLAVRAFDRQRAPRLAEGDRTSVVWERVCQYE